MGTGAKLARDLWEQPISVVPLKQEEEEPLIFQFPSITGLELH